MKRTWWLLPLALVVWFAVGFAGAQKACAHDPRFACSPRDAAHAVVITDAGKSWAYYGHLATGQTDVYTFDLAQATRVPLSLLVTQSDAHTNPGRPSLVVVDGLGSRKARVDLTKGQDFFEPFSRVDYLKSPDAVVVLPPGSYRITVDMQGAAGPQRYVLAVGEAERFSIAELPYVFGAISRIRASRY